MKKIRILSAIALSAFITGCSSIDCDLNGQVLCHYRIYDAATGEKTSINAPLSVTFIRPAADQDTVYINRMPNVSTIDLPMSHSAEKDSMTVTLHLSDTEEVTDTIIINKSNDPWFESVDCAAHYNHTIEKVSSTHHFIDNIIINNAKVSNDASISNIHLYLNSTIR